MDKKESFQMQLGASQANQGTPPFWSPENGQERTRLKDRLEDDTFIGLVFSSGIAILFLW